MDDGKDPLHSLFGREVIPHRADDPGILRPYNERDVITINLPYKKSFELGGFAPEEEGDAANFQAIRDSLYICVCFARVGGGVCMQPLIDASNMYEYISDNPGVFTPVRTMRIVEMNREAAPGICAFSLVPAPQAIQPWVHNAHWQKYAI